MKRDKAWWARLTKPERNRLVYLERCANKSYSYSYGGYLPDDCAECPSCSNPSLGGGLCISCSLELDKLLMKAEGK